MFTMYPLRISSSQLRELRASKAKIGPISEMNHIFLLCAMDFKRKVANCSEKSISWSQKLTKKEWHKIINAFKKHSKII